MPLPKLKEIEGSAELEQMIEKAREASDMLKALSHESRLLLLCILAEGEKSVTELEQFWASDNRPSRSSSRGCDSIGW